MEAIYLEREKDPNNMFSELDKGIKIEFSDLYRNQPKTVNIKFRNFDFFNVAYQVCIR